MTEIKKVQENYDSLNLYENKENIIDFTKNSLGSLREETDFYNESKISELVSSSGEEEKFINILNKNLNT